MARPARSGSGRGRGGGTKRDYEVFLSPLIWRLEDADGRGSAFRRACVKFHLRHERETRACLSQSILGLPDATIGQCSLEVRAAGLLELWPTSPHARSPAGGRREIGTPPISAFAARSNAGPPGLDAVAPNADTRLHMMCGSGPVGGHGATSAPRQSPAREVTSPHPAPHAAIPGCGQRCGNTLCFTSPASEHAATSVRWNGGGDNVALVSSATCP